jgi:hypothetical protein
MNDMDCACCNTLQVDGAPAYNCGVGSDTLSDSQKVQRWTYLLQALAYTFEVLLHIFLHY